MSSPQKRPDNFLVFSRAERLFILTCIFIGFILCLSRIWMPLVVESSKESSLDDEKLQMQLDEWITKAEYEADSIQQVRFERQQAYATRFDAERRDGYTPKRNESPTGRASRFNQSRPRIVRIDYSVALPELGTQDPNTIDSASILRLGVPRDIMLRWLKFRSRGGTFVRRADISKIYGLDDSTFTRISAFFVDGEELENGYEVPRPRGEFVMDPVEVNNATLDQLKNIRGIGNFYANQIIAYRDELGGFLTVEQIGETPLLKDSTFQAVKAYMKIDPNEITRIAINHFDDSRLARHPYISRSKAKTLFFYRQNHGPFKGVEDLYATEVLDSALVASILPYISFD